MIYLIHPNIRCSSLCGNVERKEATKVQTDKTLTYNDIKTKQKQTKILYIFTSGLNLGIKTENHKFRCANLEIPLHYQNRT